MGRGMFSVKSLSALALLVGRAERHPTYKNLAPAITKGSLGVIVIVAAAAAASLQIKVKR